MYGPHIRGGIAVDVGPDSSLPTWDTARRSCPARNGRSRTACRGSPYTNWFVVAYLALVVMLLSLDEGTRVAL